MKAKKIVLIAVIALSSTAAMAMDNTNNTFIFGVTFNIGTFSSGENDGGSVFLGGSLFTDWIPSGKTGLSFGLETGLLRGKKQNNDKNILGIPAIFRFGWYPDFFKFKNVELSLLAKIGWGFGLWGSGLEHNSTPGGIVCGMNLGAAYLISPKLSAYTEIGYNYYGLARNSDHPEYPLGYGSGKAYKILKLYNRVYDIQTIDFMLYYFAVD